MDQVSAGRVVFDGRDLAALKESELAPIRLEKMGFVFQNHQLLKNLSLFDNIILPGLVAKKEPAAVIRQRAGQLSSRISIARA